jgi:hypothetical protein
MLQRLAEGSRQESFPEAIAASSDPESGADIVSPD